MADPFQNARAYYDVTFPNSGDGFSIANMKNALQGLGFMDFLPLQPRAHAPADTKILVRGRDASSFYNPIYAGDSNQHIFFGSGDSPAMAAPVSNSRIDIVYLTPSGDIRVVTGTEAATPTLPTLAPSGDTRIPICAVFHKKTMTKIVNFEDRNSNSGDSYIYQDLRPFLRSSGMGGTTLTSSASADITGDSLVGTGTTATRSDHHHKGVRTMRLPGSGDMHADIDIVGDDIVQTAQRLTWGGKGIRAGVVFNGNAPLQILSSYNVQSVTRNGAGDYTIVWKKPFNTANYCVDITAGTTRGYAYHIAVPTATQIEIGTTDNNGASIIDQAYISVTAFDPRPNG